MLTHRLRLQMYSKVSMTPAEPAMSRSASLRDGHHYRNHSSKTRSLHFTGEELQVKFLWDSEENSLKY
jgi:hypothetical protein